VLSGVFGMAYHKENIYTNGARHLTFYTEELEKIREIPLLLADNTSLSAKNGQIFNNRLYTTDAYNYHLKYDLDGNKIGEVAIAELTNNVFLKASAGYIYIYSHINKPALGARLMQYDTLGNQKWSVAPGDVHAMVADKQGNCYVMVANGESTIVKYNPEGEVVWSKLLTGQYVRGASMYGDSLLLCGNISLNAITDKNQSCAFSIMSASSGEIFHQQVVDLYEDINESERMTQIVSDGQNIYIGGAHGDQSPQCFLVKLSREGNTTGLKDEKGSRTSFNIFPNPGGGKFTISCGESKVNSMQVTVRNVEGKVVYSKKINCNADNSFTLDLGKQAAGNYTVEIGEGKDKVMKKIIVE
jgi:hypothetical protein